jgi:hypothetical protein
MLAYSHHRSMASSLDRQLLLDAQEGWVDCSNQLRRIKRDFPLVERYELLTKELKDIEDEKKYLAMRDSFQEEIETRIDELQNPQDCWAKDVKFLVCKDHRPQNWNQKFVISHSV